MFAPISATERLNVTNSYALKSSFLSLAIAAAHGCAGPSPHAAEHLAADAEVVVASSYQVALDVPPPHPSRRLFSSIGV